MIDPNAGSSSVSSSNPAFVYDGGVARPIIVQSPAGGLTGATPLTVMVATPGMRFKVLAVSGGCAAFTAPGVIWLSDAVAYTTWLGAFKALGDQIQYSPGYVCFAGSVNTAVTLNTTGSGTWHFSAVGYLAP